jgi:RNA polymerase sigma-70 factor (ECF subfamily)
MLANQTLRGEIKAYDEIVNRYSKSVFAIIYRMTGNYEDAEDIAQDVFVTVYQKLYQFDGQKKFGPWIHKIAVNTCISSLRKKKKVVMLNFDDNYMKQYEMENHYEFADPDIILERSELKAEIESALLELPESYRLIIILRYQLDFNNQEIAEIIGASRENVEVKVHRARKALRKILLKKWNERGNRDGMPAF